MSYARWGCDGSSVYVFWHVSGWLECHCCQLVDASGDEDFRTPKYSEMIAHLLAHRAHGHTVPDSTIERLAQESRESGDSVAPFEA